MKWFPFFVLLIALPIPMLAQISGCTDAKARNYNPKAVINDGSCTYFSTKIKPFFSVEISATIHESSGLLFWKNRLWTMNDDSDTNLYSFDTAGTNLKRHIVARVKNTEWEGLTQDSLHVYIGDFGNNARGNRKDLHILKVEKKTFFHDKMVIDTLFFSFENQTNFESQKANTTNFDCEALLATRDSLYLLTKEWTSKQNRLYVLPKTPGTHQAKFMATLNTKGLISGGIILEDKKMVVLCGYSKKLQPFLYLLYGYSKNNFFSGNKRKVKLALPFHQIEGIATKEGLHFYLTNESFQKKPFISVKQALHHVDLSAYLK